MEKIIKDIIAKFYGIQEKDMLSKNRSPKYCIPRQISAYMIRYNTKMSLSKIGIACGGLNHSTIVHSIKSVDDLMFTNIKFRNDVESINKLIKARFKTDLSPNNKISELDMVKAVKRGLNDVNSRIMFNLLLKEYETTKSRRIS